MMLAAPRRPGAIATAALLVFRLLAAVGPAHAADIAGEERRDAALCSRSKVEAEAEAPGQEPDEGALFQVKSAPKVATRRVGVVFKDQPEAPGMNQSSEVGNVSSEVVPSAQQSSRSLEGFEPAQEAQNLEVLGQAARPKPSLRGPALGAEAIPSSPVWWWLWLGGFALALVVAAAAAVDFACRSLRSRGLLSKKQRLGQGMGYSGYGSLSPAIAEKEPRWPQQPCALTSEPAPTPAPAPRLSHCGTSFVVPLTRIASGGAGGVSQAFAFDIPAWPAVWPFRAILTPAVTGSDGRWAALELTVDVIAANGLPPLFTCAAEAGSDGTDGLRIFDGSGTAVAMLGPLKEGACRLFRDGTTAWEVEVRLEGTIRWLVVRRGMQEIAIATRMGPERHPGAAEAGAGHEEYLQVDAEPGPSSPESTLLLMSLLATLAFRL
mmetsp:Transcript_2079/g.4415  ORF Transcript_2079/g.4415 Transcript_2079/m.4415 type:complete len:435 (-) Transcript_2079:28-1332(-)